jgi:3-keto-5-aminohexanoate cleavage enzyme
MLRELRTTEKLIVTVATTGTIHGKEVHPNLPEQPDEIAQAAYECWNEGASIVHVHARDKNGKGTSDPEILKDIDRRIREKKSDIIIQHSTAADYVPRLSSDGKLRTIEMNPEMASLSITVPRMVLFRGQEHVLITTLPEIQIGAKAMLDRGVKPELEVYNQSFMEDVFTLIDLGLLTKPYWIQLVMGMRRINRSYMPYTPRILMQLVDSLPPDSMFTTMGIAADELPAIVQSILLGGHVRVGFEDNVNYKRGQRAESNAQLVARAARIARELGCEIATPAEARKMLNIPQLSEL